MPIAGDLSGRYVDMALHALSHPAADDLDWSMEPSAQALFECARKNRVSVGDLGFGVLLSQCERLGSSASEEEARLARLLSHSGSKAKHAVMAVSAA